MGKSHKSDLEIAQQAKLQPIASIGEKLEISGDSLEFYGKYKAKLPLNLISEKKLNDSNLILVTAITPTPSGEGKTTTSIGLTEGLNRIGKKTTVVLREPSLGPVFGIKGGAAGGGYSQVVPMEDINLHFTGDFSAIEKSNNLLAALVDNNIQSKTDNLNIDPRTVTLKRVMDMNDRSLRSIICGLGGKTGGTPRESGFNITAASEIMAILCLCESFKDLKEKLGSIYVGNTYEGKPIFARDLKAEGSMAILLKDAIKPNLVQTLEGNPAIIHGGPFANIAQGTNSVLATKIGLSLSDYVVTEAGFGADLGMEKFLNIKCQYSNLSPKTVVLVATIRALKYHGGADLKKINQPDLRALEKGLPNLEKHLENVKNFNIPVVVSLNKFPTDSKEEVELLLKWCSAQGVSVSLSEGWEFGGKGMEDLAQKVKSAVDSCQNKFTPTYSWDSPIKEKIKKIATNIYGASDVQFAAKASKQIAQYEKLGFGAFPICMAKTQKSLSDDEKLIARPKNFILQVREMEVSAGAGFLVPLCGNILRMPGLPGVPAAVKMDIDDEGTISGLS